MEQLNVATSCFKVFWKKHCFNKEGNNTPPVFGTEMREQEFMLESGKTFLNHGGYGAVPRRLNEAQRSLQGKMESNPDVYFSDIYEPLLDVSRLALASFLPVTPSNLTLVRNATEGIDSVLASIKLAPGEAILYNNLTYGAVQNAIRSVLRHSPDVELVQMTHTIPIQSTSDIVQQYVDELSEKDNIKLAVIDHITQSAIQFPINELVSVCKDRGVQVLVDGAHCPGHVKLDIENIGADFYIGNLHKWMFSPRGSAFLWVTPDQHQMIKPVVPSALYDSPFPENFIYCGTVDSTPRCCVEEVIEFYNWVGGQTALEEYADAIWAEVIPMLTSAWGTQMMDIPEEMRAPLMRCIEVPDLPGYPPEANSARMLMHDIYENYGVRTAFFLIEGKIYARISVNVYVTVKDFVQLKDAILDLKQRKIGS